MIRRRGLIGLAVATAAMTAAAVAVNLEQPGTATVEPGARLLPGLAERIGDAAVISVRTARDAFTIRRDGDSWGMADRDGYPVRASAVRAALVGLAELRLEQAKTSAPELYGRIAVDDPDADDARSLRVTVADAGGAMLADLIVGNRRPGGLGALAEAHYARRAGEARSWLAAGTLDLPRDPIDWLETRLMDIEPGRIARVVIEGPDRPPLILVRDRPAEDDLRIDGLPEHRVVDRAYRVTNVGTVLQGLDLTDVRPAAGLAFAAVPPRATFTTLDGLRVTATLAPDPDDPAFDWVRFDVATVPPAAGLADGDPSPTVAEADDMRSRLDGWAYRLPRFKIDRLRIRLEDITEPATDGPP